MKKQTVILAMALCMMGATAAMAQRNNGQQGGRPDNSQRIEQMVKEGVSKQAHPLFISDTVRQFVYAAISRIGDFKNPQCIP